MIPQSTRYPDWQPKDNPNVQNVLDRIRRVSNGGGAISEIATNEEAGLPDDAEDTLENTYRRMRAKKSHKPINVSASPLAGMFNIRPL